LESRKSGKRTPIKYENGQYVLYLWVPAVGTSSEKIEKTQREGSRYAILAAEQEQAGFPRQVTKA
jgi:hypothetical protein